MNRIKQELDYIAKHYPGSLQRVFHHMQEGKVDGYHYVNPETSCGCFYGWLSDLDVEQAMDQARKMKKLFVSEEDDFYTPIEVLLLDVRPGDTPNNNGALAQLAALMQPYLTRPSENVKEYQTNDPH